MKKLNGVEFDFGAGRIYTVPPLSVKSLMHLRKELVTLQSSAFFDPLDSFECCITVVHTALVANYPAISRDNVAELLDMGNVLDAITCVVNPKGYLKSLEQGKLAAKEMSGVNHGK
jgi:hypothetical protein